VNAGSETYIDLEKRDAALVPSTTITDLELSGFVI
jgi:hypothetical protein